jgi:Fur family transcriptional regulator, peroxide stress response regulator
MVFMANQTFNQRLATSGLRFTPQREHVYHVVLEKRDHPTAEEVFMRAKEAMSDISIATVYNCLDALVKCGLVRQVTVERGATRFCPNMEEHGHFICQECGGIYDIELGGREGFKLPRGFRLKQVDVAFRGFCPGCEVEG